MPYANNEEEGIVKSYEYHKPKTIEEAIDLMGSLENAKFIAGGTDVMVLLKQGKIMPANLVSLRNIGDLYYIDTQNGLKIGAGVTHTELANNTFIRKHYSALADATSNIGSKQIRNVATIGGNICNAAPSADTACPLLVLDAKVVIIGKTGERVIPLEEFFLGPNKVDMEKGEIVKGFTMPAFGQNTSSYYTKHARRKAMDLPILGVAARVTVKIDGNRSACEEAFSGENIAGVIQRLEIEKLIFEDVRIAMCVVAPKPMRAKKAEDALKGKVISESLLNEVGEVAASESQPRDSFRGEAWYRREMVRVLTKRVILKSVERILKPEELTKSDRCF